MLAIVHREDERPVSETDASILRALREAEGPGADEDVVDLLVSALTDEREDVAERAEDLLELLAPDSVDALVRELSLGLAPERAAAVLGRVKDARALEPLVAALRARTRRCAPSAAWLSASCAIRPPPSRCWPPRAIRSTWSAPPPARPSTGSGRPPSPSAWPRCSARSSRALPRTAVTRSPRTRWPPFRPRRTAARTATVRAPPCCAALARFIDRVEDSRGRGRPGEVPATATDPADVPGRAVSTHRSTGVAIAFPREPRRSHASTAEGAPQVAWPASNRRSSASGNGNGNGQAEPDAR